MSAVDRPRETTKAPLPRATVEAPEGNQLKLRVTWLLVFRAIVITALLATSVVLRATSTESMFERAALILYAVAGASYASILGGALYLRLRPHRPMHRLAYVQLGFDAVVAAVVVMLTGGVESVFVFVWTLTILNAAAVLQKQGARTLAAIVAALYAAILALETTGVITPLGLDHVPRAIEVLPQFVTNTVSFALVALLGGYLTEQISRTTERLDVARAEILRLEALYGAVLESLPSGVLTVDAEDRVIYCNEAGAEILGAEPAQLVGSSVTERVPALAAFVAEGSRFERTTAIAGRGERTLGGSTAALTGLAGFAGRVVVFQDLTELRRLQQDVARGERLADLGRFAAGLAHEIRNPLAAMIGCLQLLRADDAGARPLGDEGARMLQIVHREAERLSSLVSDFLTYARPSPPAIAMTPLRPLVEETLTAASASAGTVTLRCSGPDVIALCDPDQLRQVLWNLAGNALQAIKGAERSPGTVEVVLSEDRGGVFVAVDDDGPGVPAEVRPRIFEPFFTTRADGTGLGLATSHQLITQMGGWMAVQSSPLGGARMLIRLRSAATATV